VASICRCFFQLKLKRIWQGNKREIDPRNGQLR